MLMRKMKLQIDIEDRVSATLNKKSRSYVADACDYAHIVLAYIRLLRDHAQAIDNLTSVQQRCTELLIENRRLRGIG